MVEDAEFNYNKLADEVEILKAAKELLPEIVQDMGGDMSQEEMGLIDEQA